MSLSAKARRAPLRFVTGAFIVGSGLQKLKADEATAKQIHGMATGTYGFLGKIDPKLFTKGLAVSEVGLGGALLAPVVSPVVAGAGLLGFSGALMNMWWNTPGMHDEGSIRPTQAGIPIAKDVWMVGIGAALVADGLLSPAHDKKLEITSAVHEKRSRKARDSRKARKAAKKARAAAKAHAIEVARDTQTELGRRARKATKKALKRAQKSDAVKRTKKASDVTAKRLADARDEFGPMAVDKAKAARDTARDLRDEYGPIAVDKAKAARDAAKDASHRIAEVASDAASVTADRAQQAGAAARDAAVHVADRAQHAVR